MKRKELKKIYYEHVTLHNITLHYTIHNTLHGHGTRNAKPIIFTPRKKIYQTDISYLPGRPTI